VGPPTCRCVALLVALQPSSASNTACRIVGSIVHQQHGTIDGWHVSQATFKFGSGSNCVQRLRRPTSLA
jgi:hypothetical protein